MLISAECSASASPRRRRSAWISSAIAGFATCGSLGRRFCVSLENIRNCSSNPHDDGHEYRSTNPLSNAYTEEHNIDETSEPSSDSYDGDMTPATRRGKTPGDSECNGAKQQIGHRHR